MEMFNALETSKRRWPHCKIEGSGNIAVILGCSYRVVLVQTPIEAVALANGTCCPNCSHQVVPAGRWHTIEVLRPPAPRPAPRGNFASFMERD